MTTNFGRRAVRRTRKLGKHAGSSETRKKTVLIVDDEPSVRTVIQRILSRNGYETLEAADGRKALKVLAKRRPDMILLDVMMPNINGIGVCRRVRKSRRTKLIPIIMVTARGEADNTITGLDCGTDDYVVKPFGHDELLARVNRLFQRCDSTHRHAPSRRPVRGMSAPGRPRA